MDRKCCECGVPIRECMAFVNGEDWVRWHKGEIPKEDIRETCGICREKKDVKEHFKHCKICPPDEVYSCLVIQPLDNKKEGK
jgi:hypothetical protein